MRRAGLVVAVALVGLSILPTPASADPEPSVCTANIAFAYPAPGITAPLAFFVGITGTLVLNCPLLADDAGMWVLPFSVAPTTESCLAATGVAAWAAGATSPEGPVGPGGGFTYFHHFGGVSGLVGTIPVGAETHTFAAVMEWLPNLIPADCVLTGATGATATGVATIPLD